MRLHLILVFSTIFAASACSQVEPLEIEETEAKIQPTVDENVEMLPRMIAINASYCSVCKQMKPLMERLKSQCNLDGVRIESFDVSDEKHEHLIEEFRIEGLPTYLFIDEAEYEVARLVGAQEESTLKQALGVLRGEDCPGLGKMKNRKKS